MMTKYHQCCHGSDQMQDKCYLQKKIHYYNKHDIIGKVDN